MSLSLSPSSLGALTQNTAMEAVTLVATGGTEPYVFAVAAPGPTSTGVLGQVQQTAGALPNGLSLNAETGVISGTPLTAGPYAFTVSVLDANEIVAFQSFVGVIAADTTGGFNGSDPSTHNLVTVTVAAGHTLTRAKNGFTYTYEAGDTVQVWSYEVPYLKNDGVIA